MFPSLPPTTTLIPKEGNTMRWFTSDFHFGHARIIELSNRPFRDLDHMHATIIDTLNERIAPDDELWILGDVALGNQIENLQLLRRLTVKTIHIVAGNHDNGHPAYTKGKTTPKTLTWRDTLTDLGVATIIHENTTLTLTDGTPVQISHFPYATSGDARPAVNKHGVITRADRFAEYRPVDDDRWLIHGHVHETFQQAGKCINVGLDAWNGQPVAEDTILTRITAGPANHPAATWLP